MSTPLPSLNNNHRGALEKRTVPVARCSEDCGCSGQLPDLCLNMCEYEVGCCNEIECVGSANPR